jgi:subtilisin family serine protease
MSLGGPAGSSLDDDMAIALGRLEDSGVLVAIAAGNESQDTANVVPAGLDKGVVVSAYDASNGYGGFAWFSNYGDEVDIAAPGVSINSTVPGGSYSSYDGTSMASPHVAGAAAVYFAMNPNASFQDAMDALINTGENDYDGQGNKHLEPLLDISGW